MRESIVRVEGMLMALCERLFAKEDVSSCTFEPSTVFPCAL